MTFGGMCSVCGKQIEDGDKIFCITCRSEQRESFDRMIKYGVGPDAAERMWRDRLVERRAREAARG